MSAVEPVGRLHVDQLRQALQSYDGCAEVAQRWGGLLADTFDRGGRLLAAGNGGSAAQAQHLTAELVGRYRLERAPLSAICLSAETSSLTAIINDYPPEELFARQVQAHGRPGDVVVLLSTSGTSPNVVAAARRARELGLTVLAFTGPRPNELAELADEALCVDAPHTATVQELHLVALHILCAAVDDARGQPTRRPTRKRLLPSNDAPPQTRPSTASPVSHIRLGRRRGPLVVIGDALLDIDLVGRVGRLAPDAPVPVVDDPVEHYRPGGAALAALMAAQDGHEVVLVTPLGTDEAAHQLVELLAGVHVVPLPYDGPTPVKQRVRASGQSLVRIDRGGAAGRIGDVPAAVADLLERASAVLVADYGRGTTAVPKMRELLSRLPSRCPLVWDPHPKGAEPVERAHLITPNQAEARSWGARYGVAHRDAVSDLASIRAYADGLASAWHARAVAVTLGARGALLSYGEGSPVVTPAPQVHCVDPCGAGDRFAVSAALALGAGQVLTEAVQEAVSAASAYVAAGGPAGLRTPVARLVDDAAPPVSAEELAAHASRRGDVVVATGGCFDLLHAGHVATLRAARQLGDCLIVCLNSDASVRRLKGPSRPLVPVEDRARVLEALECVDAVLVFDEDTPLQVLERLRPHIWAKGGDYAGATVPEAAALDRWGGQAVVLPYLAGRSTSQLVEVAVTSAPAERLERMDLTESDTTKETS